MKRIFWFALSIILVLGFSCSKDKDEEPEQQASKYRLIKKVYDDGYMENYYYTEKGLLRKISASDGFFEEFIYNNENKCTKWVIGDEFMEYYYKNGLLEFATYSGVRRDTAFFIYNNKNLISQMIMASRSNDGITKRNTYELTYDNNNRLISKIKKQFSNSSPGYDSTVYKWSSEGNLLELRDVDNSSGVVYLEQERYEYDSYLNYSKTIPYPESYIITQKIIGTMNETFSNNNMSEIWRSWEGGAPRLYNVTESENGLPKRIVGQYASWNLTYEAL